MSVGEIPAEVPIDAIPGGDPTAVLPPPPSALPPMSVPELASAALPPPIAPVTPIDFALAEGASNLAAPVPVEPKTPVEATKQNLEKAKELGDEAAKIAEEKAANDIKLADETAKFKVQHQAELERLTQRQEAHRQEAEKVVTDMRAKAESMPYHTFFESRSNGQKALIGIGLILNGVSWNPQHVNRGIQMLEDAEKNELELQKAKHADLWKAVDEARQGVRDLDQNQLRELSAFSAQEGARWDAIAGRLGAAAAANKGKGDVNAIKKEALKAAEFATAAWQNAATAEAQARHQEAIDKERDEHNRAMEELRRKKLAAGGAGGTGSPALQANAVKLREEIEAAQAAGKPLTGAQVDRRALELKIPPVAKAGRISVKTILDNIKETGAINKVDHTVEDKDRTRIVYDPETNKPYAIAQTAKNAATFMKQDVQLGDAAHRLEELANHIAKYGKKIDPTNQELTQERIRKFANAVIAIGIVSPLGKTNESLHLETESIGIPGTIDWAHMSPGEIAKYALSYGASEKGIRDKVAEIKHNRQMYRNTIPHLSDEEIKKFSSGGGVGSSEGKWVQIPARLAGEPEAKGKKEMLVSSSGKFLGEFR